VPVKTPVPQIQKVFCFFFSKKKSLPHRIELTDRTVIGHTGWYYRHAQDGPRLDAPIARDEAFPSSTTINIQRKHTIPARLITDRTKPGRKLSRQEPASINAPISPCQARRNSS
jgi:hypothetical protein